MMEHSQHAIVLGKTGVGKTSMIKTVSKIVSSDLHIINPVGLPSGYLFGFNDSFFFEKGVVETVLELPTHELKPKWILFDGAWTSWWIDGISSIFQKDAGGSLCISNGNRIFLEPNTTVLIESSSLENASAGFVGRFNVVYLHQEWSWRTRLESWFNEKEQHWMDSKRFDIMRSQTKIICGLYMQQMINFVEEIGSPLSILVLFNHFLDLYDSILSQHLIKLPTSNEKEINFDHHEDSFFFSLIWSFGMVEPDHRAKTDSHIIQMSRMHKSVSRLAQILAEGEISVFQLTFDTQSFTWSKAITDELLETCTGSLIIQQRRRMIELLLKNDKRVLLLGPLTTGKSRMANDILKQICNTVPGMSAVTRSCLSESDFTNSLQKLLVKDKNDYKPANGGKLVVFIDDLHMAQPDKDGIKTFWEFVRSLADHDGYWASPDNYRHISRVILMGAMDKGEIPGDKVLRHFSVIYTNEHDSFEDKCSNYLRRHLKKAPDCLGNEYAQTRIRSIGKAALQLITKLKSSIFISSEKPFNFFTCHHLENLYNEFLIIDNAVLKGNVSKLIDLWIYYCGKHFKVVKSLNCRIVYLSGIRLCSTIFFTPPVGKFLR